MTVPYTAAPNVYTAAEYGFDHHVSREELIVHYFQDGYSANEVLAFLYFCHGIVLSLRHLRRIQHRLGLRRRRQAPLNEVVEALQFLLQEDSCEDMGYRFIWRILTTRHNLQVSQHTVRRLLGVMDPEGVALRSIRRFRRRRYSCAGPNYIIHVDGFDKLTAFGLSVHAAIDGFSRRILWIRVGPTNKNPRYIAKFFMDMIETLQGVPKIVRADRGTENSLLRDIQIALRLHHNDSFKGNKSFMYGRSTANQRIEAWWSMLKRLSANVWINYFKDLRDTGILDTSNDLHIECVRFVFTEMIQKEFTRNAELWNQHRIRHQRDKECPSGKPDVLYFCPEMYGSQDFKMPLDYSHDDLQAVKDEHCEEPPTFGCSPEFLISLNDIVGDVNNYAMPSSKEEALQLFLSLIELMS